MNRLIERLDELIRPSREESGSASERLGLDLAIAAVGLAAFGFVLPPEASLLWRGLVALKVAGAFLLAFVVTLAPIFAIKTFFDVEVAFAKIVAAFARHLGLGGVFATAAAGVFALVRHGEAHFDGSLALGLIVLLVGAVLACRRKRELWLPPLPALMAVALFLSVLAQGAWAFRPYMDPAGPTLFAAKSEWFAGAERAGLERAIVRLAHR